MAEIEFVLKRDEIKKTIAYDFICTTRDSSVWNTTRRKRRWKMEFTEEERSEAEKIFKQAHSWTLVKGVPDEVRMNYKTFELWNRIANFCYSLL